MYPAKLPCRRVEVGYDKVFKDPKKNGYGLQNLNSSRQFIHTYIDV
jgi:hypothetical protein